MTMSWGGETSVIPTHVSAYVNCPERLENRGNTATEISPTRTEIAFNLQMGVFVPFASHSICFSR